LTLRAIAELLSPFKQEVMTMRVSLQNSAGELDGRTVKTEEEARAAALELIESTPYLNVGDKIIVTDD
jgi:hypothetical protein